MCGVVWCGVCVCVCVCVCLCVCMCVLSDHAIDFFFDELFNINKCISNAPNPSVTIHV